MFLQFSNMTKVTNYNMIQITVVGTDKCFHLVRSTEKRDFGRNMMWLHARDLCDKLSGRWPTIGSIASLKEQGTENRDINYPWAYVL